MNSSPYLISNVTRWDPVTGNTMALWRNVDTVGYNFLQKVDVWVYMYVCDRKTGQYNEHDYC